jgi:hypothetical protein
MPARGALVLAIALCAFAAQGASARPPSQAPAPACHISASAPFLYSVVIPVSAVECDGTARRLRISTQLTRDGVMVASSSRSCRDTSSCWLTVDASAPDEPGDQVWCTVTSGYAGTTFLGSASACETEEF